MISSVVVALNSKVSQVDRFSNPFGTNIAFFTIFGDVTLGLTEDGEHMLIWDNNTKGMSPVFWMFIIL